MVRLAIGIAINDSGTVVPAVGATLAIRVLELENDGDIAAPLAAAPEVVRRA
jgi:hypothetical protein